MGSFNVVCSISSISIDCGDDVVYIPLEVSKYPYKIGDGNSTLIYLYCFYSPVTLPVFGSYDDYGRIGDIKRDANIEVTEAHFDEKIEDVCGMYDREVRPVSSGMFIHREIFDTLVEKCSQVDEWGKRDSESGEDYLSNHFDKFVENIQQAKEFHKKHSANVIISGRRIGWELWLSGESHNIFNFRNYWRFREIYFPQIENGKLKKELVQFVKFETGMFAVNRFYFPAMKGYQHGNVYASKLLYEKAASIMREKSRKR